MPNLLNTMTDYKNELAVNGYAIVDAIYTEEEVENILAIIDKVDSNKETFRKSTDLFAIRQFMREVPDIAELIFNQQLKSLIKQLLGDDYFLVKSIYFDKPEASNWYVAYHQDLTISVDQKATIDGFGPWTVKQNQFAVQPPLPILENVVTMRIHLDDTGQANGALKVVPKSHLKQVYRPENINWTIESEAICDVKKGELMLMKPLLLHSSNRTTNGNKRRVVHLEFSNCELPAGLNWAERMEVGLKP